MNLREGTRRLALLLGVAGAIVGGFASYMELQTTLTQRTAHEHFERLANSAIVQQQRKTLQSAPDFIPDTSAVSGAALEQDRKNPHHKPMGKYTLADIAPALPAGATGPEPNDTKTDWFARNAPTATPATPAGATGATVVQQPTRTPEKHFPDKWAKYIVPSDRAPDAPAPQSGDFLSGATPISTGLNKGGIKTINWSRDYAVQSIETEDGQTLYPTPSPSGWSYFLIVILPILGFLIPWGAIRAIVWVGAGFAQSA